MSSSPKSSFVPANCFKIIVLGDSGVGKSSIVSRYFDKTYSSETKSTIAVDYRTRTWLKEGHRIHVQCWDTAGQEQFRSLYGPYYREVKGVLLVYDITNVTTFANVMRWLEDVRRYEKDQDKLKTRFLLVGNKSDLDGRRRVQFSDAITLAGREGMIPVETSAQGDVNIDNAFSMLLEEIFMARRQEIMGAELMKTQPGSQRVDVLANDSSWVGENAGNGDKAPSCAC